MQGAQVWSLVGELRSYIPWSIKSTRPGGCVPQLKSPCATMKDPATETQGSQINKCLLKKKKKRRRRYWKIRLTSSKVQGINMYKSGVLTHGHNILHIWQSWLLALPSFSIHASITEDERTRAFSKEQINSIWGEGKAGSHIRLFFCSSDSFYQRHHCCLWYGHYLYQPLWSQSWTHV